ncbi:MAG TPA: hypothetical protein VHY91_12885 [Pirellulales bacterium]|nr:hypothetical protein [Pirellulales bacterium]
MGFVGLYPVEELDSRVGCAAARVSSTVVGPPFELVVVEIAWSAVEDAALDSLGTGTATLTPTTVT